MLAGILLVAVGLVVEPHTTADVELLSEIVGRGDDKEFVAEVVATPVGSPDYAVEPVRQECRIPGKTTLELAAEVDWSISVVADGYWSQPLLFTPKDHKSTDVTLTTRLYPAATLAGVVEAPNSESTPGELLVSLASLAQPELTSVKIRCPITTGNFSCRIPAGKLDIKLRAEGYISHFLWDREVLPGKITDLATLELKRGASVIGWVEVVDGKLDPASCELQLKPSVGHGRRQVLSESRSQHGTLKARVNKRGFFHFAGVPTGIFTVRAEQPGFAPASVQVRVLETIETGLPGPLQLQLPVTLEVSLIPPVDPYGKPWSLRLVQEADRQKARPPSHEQEVPEDGYCKIPDVAPGSYFLLVESEPDAHWKVEAVDIDRMTHPLTIEIQLIRVNGILRAGDQAKEGTVWFGGARGGRRIRFDADRNGEFFGFLPEEGVWPVDIDTEGYRVPSRKVNVQLEEGEDTAYVEINLPETNLAGEVVDESGSHVRGVMVRIKHSNREMSRSNAYAKVDRDGKFELSGMSPGLVYLQAQSHDVESEWVTADLVAGEETTVRLVVASRKEVTGVVLSKVGPVPGAMMQAFPFSTGHLGPVSMRQEMTAPDGSFAFQLPPGTVAATLAIVPPSFATKLVSISPSASAPISIYIEDSGGTITLVGKLAHQSSIIVHNQAVLPVAVLQHLSRSRVGGDNGRLLLSNIESGQYSVCADQWLLHSSVGVATEEEIATASCVSGFLPPNGALQLSLK
jgi:hypothetical protein